MFKSFSGFQFRPIEPSPDGWATVVDGDARRRALQGPGMRRFLGLGGWWAVQKCEEDIGQI